MEEVPSTMPVENGTAAPTPTVTENMVLTDISTSTTTPDIMVSTRKDTRTTTNITVVRSKHTPTAVMVGTRNKHTVTIKVMVESTVTRRVTTEVTNTASMDTKRVPTGAHPSILEVGNSHMVTTKLSQNFICYFFTCLYFFWCIVQISRHIHFIRLYMKPVSNSIHISFIVQVPSINE